MPPKPKKIETASEAALRIRELREFRGETQTAFAQTLGTKPSAVSKWEAGNNLPQPKIFARMANLAGGQARHFFQALAGILEDGSSAVFDGSGFLPHVERKVTVAAPTSVSKEAEVIPWDRELLVQVVATVDKNLKEKGLMLPSEKYGQLIALMYEYCHGNREKPSDIVERFLAVA